MVGLCYAALLLNIGAALSGFLIIDAMGEMQYRAATVPLNTPFEVNVAAQSWQRPESMQWL